MLNRLIAALRARLRRRKRPTLTEEMRAEERRLDDLERRSRWLRALTAASADR